MAHHAQKEKEVILETEKVPPGYVATLCFIVKGDHLLDIHVTQNHLEQLVTQIQELTNQPTT